MEGAVMLLCVVVIAVVIAAAIFTGIDVYLAMSKTARGRKSKYFNIGYRPVYGIEFCRAHLVGKVDKFKHKALYVVEIHPRDAAKAYAWAVPETKLYEGHLLEKGKFYKLVFKEELYERTKATP